MKLHFGFLRSFPLLPPLPPADNPKLVNILSLQKFLFFFFFLMLLALLTSSIQPRFLLFQIIQLHFPVIFFRFLLFSFFSRSFAVTLRVFKIRHSVVLVTVS